MHRQLILAGLALLLAAPAHAGRVLVDGFEYGAGPTTPSYAAVVGAPDVEASSVTATGVTGDDWSWEFDSVGASSNNEYVQWTLTATSEASVQARIRVNACPTTERAFLGFGTSSNRHCYVALGPDCRLRVYYGDSGNECSQSNNDGTPCTSLADCEPIEGEATPSYVCGTAAFAQSAVLATDGTWYNALLTQDLSPSNEGDVQCGLHVDGVNRGAATRAQGACSGGDDAGDACSTDAQCAGGGNCVFSAPTSTWARLGAHDGVASTHHDVNVTHWIIDGTAVDPVLATARVSDLHPNGDGSPNDWNRNGCSGSSYLCIDDTSGTAAPDGDSTNLGSTTAAGGDEEWALSDNTLGAGESVPSGAAVAVACTVHERNSANNVAGKNLTLCISDSTTPRCASTYDLNQFGEAYKLMPPALFTTDQTNTAWSDADLDSLFVRVKDEAACGTPSQCTHNVTDCVVQAEITTPAPQIPTALEDVGGDLEITVAFLGDSTCDGAALYEQLVGNLEQVDNLYDGCFGGRMVGDIRDHLTALLDGETSGTLPVSVKKGSGARKVDYAFIGSMGWNDLASHPTSPLTGRCIGGSNDGGTCLLLDGHSGQHSATGGADPRRFYCGDGELVGQECSGPTDCCPDWESGDGDNTGVCRTGQAACDGIDTPCAAGKGPCKLCTGVPITGNSGNCDPDSPAVGSWCWRGRLDSPSCPSGFCFKRTELAYLQREFTEIIDAALARSGASEVRPVIMANHLPEEQTANTGFACMWRDIRSDVATLSDWMIALAQSRGVDYVDFKREFYERSNEGVTPPIGRNADRMIRFTGFTEDGVHPNEPTPATGKCSAGGVCGTQAQAQLAEACLEGTPDTNASCTHLKSTPTPTP